MADVKTKVYNALAADATLTAIIGGRLFYNLIEDLKTGPAVVFVVKLVKVDKELTGEIIGKTYGVNIKCISDSQAQVYEIVEAVEAVTVAALGAENETDDEPIFESEFDTYSMNIDFEAN